MVQDGAGWCSTTETETQKSQEARLSAVNLPKELRPLSPIPGSFGLSWTSIFQIHLSILWHSLAICCNKQSWAVSVHLTTVQAFEKTPQHNASTIHSSGPGTGHQVLQSLSKSVRVTVSSKLLKLRNALHARDYETLNA